MAQFSGATSGVALATFLLRGAPGDGAVRYAVTAPGVYGAAVAFAAELAISFILMITVLLVTNHERLARYTSYFVGSLYAVNNPLAYRRSRVMRELFVQRKNDGK
jgi:aquaporin Z